MPKYKQNQPNIFAATFKEFPPRAFPPSFNPANVLDQTLHNIKAIRALHELKEEKVLGAAAGSTTTKK